MKAIGLLIGLMCSFFLTTAQTLQTVTDNGSSTTNTLNSSNPNGFQVTGSAGSPAYIVIDQTVNSGGKRWRFGHTGTTSGFGSFDILNITDGIAPLSIASGGNVGIGSLLPDNKLTIKDNNPFVDVQSAEDGQTTGIWMRYRNSPFAGAKLYYSTADAVTYLDNLYPNHPGTPYASFNIRSNNAQDELISRLFIQGTNGDVGIGTSDPKGYKLAVNGKIRAHEIKVETVNWPDYVFAKNYQLPSLQETEMHIKEKGHLPGIPSALEVKANGIDLGEMNAKLLQKIEELTLHLIEKNKQIENLEVRLRKVETLTIK